MIPQAERNPELPAPKTLQNEIEEWIKYFCNTILKAQEQAETQITFTLKKVRFFDYFGKVINERQIRVLGKMLEEGLHAFW